MFVDTRTVPNGAQINADICIIGAGAAGISIARQLLGKQHKVILLESGGMDLDGETQSLYEGSNTGREYWDLDIARLRFFGGTTNHWAGWSHPLDPIAFKKRPWVPGSGWPISRADLDPYYQEANKIIEIGPHNYETDYWRDKLGDTIKKTLPLEEIGLESDCFQISPPTRFGEIYQGELERASNVTTYLYSNVVEIVTTANGQEVKNLTIKTLSGNTINVAARINVLATGGMENARLLMLSNRTHPKGIGNSGDHVGRYFQDHVEFTSGMVAVSSPVENFEWYNPANASSTNNRIVAYFGLTPEMQAKEGLVGTVCTVHEVVDPGEGSAGFGSLRRIIRAVKNGRIPTNLGEDILNIIYDIDEIASYTYNKIMGNEKNRNFLLLNNRVEQMPDAESRITLDTEKDALGLNKIKLHWRVHELELRSVRRTHELFAKAIGKASMGRVRIDLSEKDDVWPSTLQGGFHHMGTTRMSDDPKLGVVDANCKVHGMENLYIAGSSVFPIGGNVPPTLTIVALALRLTKHLTEKLG